MFPNDPHPQAAVKAIRALRQQVRWKPNKAEQHLRKRKARGDLPQAMTLQDYDALVQSVLGEASSRVYHYPFGSEDYYAVSGEVESRPWLVIFSAEGVMETAFPPRNLIGYLARHGMRWLGHLEEIENE